MTAQVHFQSIYRRFGLVISEPLCGPEREAFETSPRRDEVTCQFCLKLLMSAKEYRNA